MKDIEFKITALRLKYGPREYYTTKYDTCEILKDIVEELKDLHEQNIILKERLDGAELRCRMLSDQINNVIKKNWLKF